MAIRSRADANEHERRLRERSRAVRRGERKHSAKRKLSLRAACVVLAMTGLFAGWTVHHQREQASAAQRHPYPYSNCIAALADGASNFTPTDPRYTPRQDRDGDGVACEPYS